MVLFSICCDSLISHNQKSTAVDIDQIKKVLERYAQGKCNDEEIAAIEQWFASINRHRSAMIEDDFLQDQLEEVRMRLQEQITRSEETPIVPMKRRKPWLWLAAAAMVTGVLAFILLDRTASVADTPQLAHTATPAKSNRVVQNGFVTITTTKGATEKVVLEDGSTIVVNSSSRLRYPEKFGDARNVFLEEGEAFFKVASDPARAFVVHSGGIATTALGTSFNIRAYEREQRITVALLTGKVKVDHADQPSTILLPSEQLHFDRQSLHIAKTTFEKEEDIVGWKQGYLVFKDATYDEVIAEIENRYNVTVINESDKLEWNYTGFFKDENLQDIIETICLTKNISYTIKNDTIFLKSKN